MGLPWQNGLVWCLAGMALGWLGQWLYHRQTLAQWVLDAPAQPLAAPLAAPAAPAPDAAAPELARVADELARLNRVMAEREGETQRLSQTVALLDQQVMQLNLARSGIGQPRSA